MKLNIKQGLLTTGASYIGLLISTVGYLFLFSHYPSPYGYLQFLLSTGMLLIPFTNLGINNLAVRYFPEYADRDFSGFRFLDVLIASNITIFLALIGLYFLARKPISHSLFGLGFDVDRISVNILSIISISLSVSLITLLTKYLTNFQKLFIPTAVHILGHKIALLALIFFYVQSLLSLGELVVSYTLFYAFVALFLIIYAKFLERGRVTKTQSIKLDFRKKKEILTYSLYTNLSQIGAVLTYRIDIFMISTTLGYTLNGVYTLLLFVSSILQMPVNALNSLAGPIISAAWQEKDMTRISEIYKRSSTNLTVAGICLLSVIWYNLPMVFSLAGNTDLFLVNRYVFLLLALSQLWNMITSVNAQIISYTSLFRYNLYFMVFLGTANVIGNYLLIIHYDYQLIGAALATTLTMLVYNLLKLILIYRKFGIHPFQKIAIPLWLYGIVPLLLPSVLIFLGLSSFLAGLFSVLLIMGFYLPIIYINGYVQDVNYLIDSTLVKAASILNNIFGK